MKRVIKAALKTVWRLFRPAVRPLRAWFEATLARSLQPTETRIMDESRVLMEHVIRELIRLQQQVDQMEDSIRSLRPAPLAGRTAADAAPGEHLKAG
jgi:hypothetical protein